MNLKKIFVKQGQDAIIELDSKKGTAFKWEVSDNHNQIEARQKEIAKKGANKSLLKSIFTLKAKKPGTYEIDFELSAPFISSPQSRQRYQITFA